MAASEIGIIERLDQEDKEKVSYFIRLLLNKSKYQQLKKEVMSRREEIKSGETISHEDLWKQMNV
uniref:hypothetical protein n=1 Tax=Candidatus Electronema sp. TaxID=2698783 RepID=UPI00405706C0